jgi:hypothetical protein
LQNPAAWHEGEALAVILPDRHWRALENAARNAGIRSDQVCESQQPSAPIAV